MMRRKKASVATLQECFDELGRYGPRTLSHRAVQMVQYCNQLPSTPWLQHYKIKYCLTPRAETVAALNAAGAHRANVLT
jgi:hypothetical protein